MVKQLMATTALVALLVAPVAAQQAQDQNAAPAPPLTGTEAPAPAPPAPLVAVELSEVTADELIGSPVINAGEETLGAIDDAIFDADGKLMGVVVSFGGFLGFGSKTVQLPIDQVAVKTRGDGTYSVQIDLEPAALEAMPAYEKS